MPVMESAVRLFVGLVISAHVGFGLSGLAVSDEPDVRRTPAVVAVEKAYPCVAAVYVQREGRLYSGSGTVIDPRGYVLTCDHILGGPSLVLLPDRPALRSKVVARLPERDLAILKVGSPQWPDEPAAVNDPLVGKPLPFVELGDSEQTMLAETVLNIGNPGGRGVIATQGIISSTGLVLANALASARRENDAGDRFVQFDAPSNGGNSGGALIDLRGHQIGIVTGGIRDEEGINYAVPIDAFRENLQAMLHAELRNRFTKSFEVAWNASVPTIGAVEPGGPAAAAGLKQGDTIVAVDGVPVASTLAFQLTTLDWKPDQLLTLACVHADGEQYAATVKLGQREPTKPVETNSPSKGLLCRSIKLAEEKNLVPIPTGRTTEQPPVVVPIPVANPPGLPGEDWYELDLTGFVRIPKDGIYRFELESDDGSALYIHDQLVIDNGQNHPARTRSTWQLLAAGDHPIRVCYYEATGEAKLELRIGEGLKNCEPVKPDQLFHVAP